MKIVLIFIFSFIFQELSAQTYLGNYSGYSQTKNSITVNAESSSIRLVFYTSDIVRIDYLPSSNSKIDSSIVVIQKPDELLPVTIRETEENLFVESDKIIIDFKKHPLRFSFSNKSGNELLSEPLSGGFSSEVSKRKFQFSMTNEIHFYGTGERGTGLDKRGLKFESYNTQIGGYSTPLPTMNLNAPILATSNGYALYIDNYYRGFFDLGASDSTVFSYTADGGELSLYFILGESIPEQLEKYTGLTGRQPLPPRWMFGYIQSKNRYKNEQEARSIVDTIRSKKIPADALVLDLAWFENMGDISWNEKLWGEHEKMISDFLSVGMKTILITEPYIIQPSINFSEAESKGFLAKDSSGKTFILEKWWSCGGCNSSLLDLTNPEAQTWWWKKHPTAFGKNVAGIWTDLGEPERHPTGMIHFLGSAEKIHNIYNLLWSKTIFEGFNEFRPNERVVNLTRSGFSGSQRYGILPWSGDVSRTFGGLEVQMPMLLNMGMSGFGYQNSDIGGYARNPTTAELYTRWMQFGTFCPITRAHGSGVSVNGSPTEPWMFGKEAENVCRDFINLRYQLLPYIYTLAYQNYKSGLPLARPLFWLDVKDKNLSNESSSFMWGDAFLVSPIVKAGQTKKDIYFPKGNWINFWTDEIIKGGSILSVDSPLDKMPIFIKSGSIIPMGPLMNYSDERPLDTLTVHFYPENNSETVYSLYEDDGKSLAYQKGNFSLTTFSQKSNHEKGKRVLNLNISESAGVFVGKLTQRIYIFCIHRISEKPATVICNESEITEKAGQNKNLFFYDRKSKQLSILINTKTDSRYEVVVK